MLANSKPLHAPLTPGLGSKVFFFSESSHVAYQINGNEAWNNIQANILPFTQPQPLDGVKRSRRFFQTKAMLHINSKGKKCRTLCK